MFGTKLNVKEFENEVSAYESVPVEKGRILLYGDSLFTRCSFTYNTIYKGDNPLIEENVLMRDGSPAILNHGLGGSSADHLLYYYDRMVRPYEPRALVLSTGANDRSLGYSPMEIMEILGRVVDYAQTDFPGIPIYIFDKSDGVGHKNVEDHYTRHRKALNSLIRIYCSEKSGCKCLSLVRQPFMYSDPKDVGDRNKIREDIYEADMGHFNKKGYFLFFDFLRQELKDLL